MNTYYHYEPIEFPALKADEILDWLDFDKGTAKDVDIETVHSCFNTTGATIFVDQDHKCSQILSVGQTYGIESALKAIGCTREV